MCTIIEGIPDHRLDGIVPALREHGAVTFPICLGGKEITGYTQVKMKIACHYHPQRLLDTGRLADSKVIATVEGKEYIYYLSGKSLVQTMKGSEQLSLFNSKGNQGEEK